MGKVIKFPDRLGDNKLSIIDRLEHRLTELETENSWSRADIVELGIIIEKNIKEMQVILRELAVLQGFEEPLDLSFDDSDDLEPDF
jgi:hypothetical protein|tara:strand:- start:802 stop:1059 length:258 start_codon:yes stop_codon:yes gene_type:complete